MSSTRTARRLNRILAMLPWVISHHGATVDDVCSRFGYSPEQLLSDLDLVFVCGLPGYGPGELMVAYVDEDEVVVETADYFSAPLRLSAPEALGLVAAGRAVLSSGQAPAALESAVTKLERALFPGEDTPIEVDLTEPDMVAELRAAASEAEVTHITYTALSSGVTTERDIEPWSVFSTLGNWYVSGHCRLAEAERVFRIDRIREASATGEHFDPPADVPPPIVRYTPNVEDVQATIRLHPAARWVAEYYPVDLVEEEAGGALLIGFSASDAAVPARLLVRLGADAELVAGPEVAAEVDSMRRRILARYGALAPND